MPRTADQELEAFTVLELATRLRVSPRTVERWIASGDLPAFKLGRNVRVRGADVEAFLQRHQARDSGAGQ